MFSLNKDLKEKKRGAGSILWTNHVEDVRRGRDLWAGPGKSFRSSRSQAEDRNGGASREDGGKVLPQETR